MLKQNDFVFDHSRSIDLICMGRLAVDLYAEQIDTPLNEAQGFKKYLGGCAGNIAVGTARQGLKSAMFSCIGSDEMGTFLKNTLLREGVDITLLSETSEHLTALVLLGVCPPNHFPLIFYRENCADMQVKATDCDEAFLQKAKAILITGTGLSAEGMREATHHAVNVAKKVGTKVIIDLDYRPVLWKLAAAGDGETRFLASNRVTQEYIRILTNCDLIIGTEEEVAIASGCENMKDTVSKIHQLTNAPIVLKTGEKGCQIYIKNQKAPLGSRPFKVDVFNVLGAGDAFMSGLLGQLLKGESWQEAGTYANACGALVVTRHGCAPAIPGYEEATFFIKNYQTNHLPDLINSKELSLLHRQVCLGAAKDQPLTLLAYDHRWQFEASCDEYQKPYTKIKQFKEAVFSGFKAIHQAEPHTAMGIIIDQQYGANVIKEAAFMDIHLCTPCEASGTRLLKWRDNISAYSSIVENSAKWTVKVLWKYHPQMKQTDRGLQLKQLKELAYVCDKLDRRLMLELIIPTEYQLDGKNLAHAMQDVYEQTIYPFYWKLPALTDNEQWQIVDNLLDQYDPTCRIIVLGGKAQSLDHYQTIFAMAKTSRYVNGFALGRSIFWQSWQAYIAGEIDEITVSRQISDNYTTVLNLWRQTAHESA